MTTFDLAEQERKKYGVDATWQKEESLPSFEVRLQNGRLVIAAPNEVQFLYGVYACAEKFNGYTFFEPGRDQHAPEERVAPSSLQEGVLIPARKPLLAVRGFVQEFPFNADTVSLFDWMAKNRLNYLITWMKYYDEITPEQKEAARLRGVEIESSHHNFNYWIPGTVYGKTHPDFFAMINGKRITPSGNCELLLSEQLCTTNPEVRAEFVRRMVEYCQAHPEIKSIGLTPNDGFGWCECPECSKFYDKNKKGELYCVSGHVYQAAKIYHDLVRDVSEKFHRICPQINLTFSAYINYCRPAPGMTLEKGLTVHFAPYWRCINHEISQAACPINSRYADDILSWMKVKHGGKFFIYEYFMGVNFYLSLPMIHFHEMFREMQWYAKIGVDGVNTQFHIPHWTVYGMNYYLMGQAAWGYGEEESIALLYRRLFGKDATTARHFYDEIKALLLSAGQCHIPHPYSLFTRTTLAQYERIQTLAEELLALSPDSHFRQELALWADFLCRFKGLFDKNLAGQAQPQDVQELLDWVRTHKDSRVFVQDRFEMYFAQAKKMLQEGKRWIHFGIDWEDKVILQEEKEYFRR